MAYFILNQSQVLKRIHTICNSMTQCIVISLILSSWFGTCLQECEPLFTTYCNTTSDFLWQMYATNYKYLQWIMPSTSWWNTTKISNRNVLCHHWFHGVPRMRCYIECFWREKIFITSQWYQTSAFLVRNSMYDTALLSDVSGNNWHCNSINGPWWLFCGIHTFKYFYSIFLNVLNTLLFPSGLSNIQWLL